MAANLTQEEIAALPEGLQVIHQMQKARDRGDNETYHRLQRRLKIPAESLMAAKRTMGADWIRERGLRTELADAKYGPDWLDRDD